VTSAWCLRWYALRWRSKYNEPSPAQPSTRLSAERWAVLDRNVRGNEMSVKIKPDEPTKEFVSKWIDIFDNDYQANITEKTIQKLFHTFPFNNRIEEIVIKATTIDRLYSTNVYSIIIMADHILSIDIDKKLNNYDVDVVEEIANIERSGSKRRHYSFATKYCHWHKPDKYPIYDSYVQLILSAYNAEYHFTSNKTTELHKYDRYIEVLDQFKKQFRLQTLSYRELDKFLWKYSKYLYYQK
jgi:hypothetical protein